MSEEKHTPLPWRQEDDRVMAGPGLLVSECHGCTEDEVEDNASLIVRSVNALPALVKALEEIANNPKVSAFQSDPKLNPRHVARAALAAYRSSK